MSIIQGHAKQRSVRSFYPKVINGSLRFNDDDSAYLSWTPASAGNRKTWTWSGWVKRGNSVYGTFFSAGSASPSPRTEYGFYQDKILLGENPTGSTWYTAQTDAVFRDYSAWYHIVISADMTQATSTDRLKCWVNGELQTFSSYSVPSQNTDLVTNNTVPHVVGGYAGGSGGNPSQLFDGYLADVHFIDGQALTADDFGELKNGVWVAKDYAGTYGTNGFYLTFEDDTEVEAFNTVLYRGNGGTQSITGMGFQPDLVWLKERSSTSSHQLHDAVRGAGTALFSNSTGAESSSSTYVSSFDSDGFTVGSSGGSNESGQTYVAWGWKAGDSNVSNTDGSITSTVRANDTYGFSIVSWVGSGSASDTIGHGLSSKPNFIIYRNRDEVKNWIVTADGLLGTDGFLHLNETIAKGTAGEISAPTSSLINLTSYTAMNNSGSNMIAYCWAEKAGYSKFGSYTGTGTTTGNIVTLGFRPAFLLIKRTDTASTNGWYIWDGTRNVGDAWDKMFYANLSNAEDSGSSRAMNVTDTTFQPAATDSNYNASGGEYIYAAFADTREAAFWLDQSGNDNDWQPVNLDHNDTVADSPTDNFATLNAVYSSSLLSEGNLKSQYTGSASRTHSMSTHAVSTGKWYAEILITISSNYPGFGIVDVGNSSAQTPPDSGYIGALPNEYSYFPTLGFYSNNTLVQASTATFSTGDVVGLALDLESVQNTLKLYKNGVLAESLDIDDPVTAYAFCDLHLSSQSAARCEWNFGQQPFKYDPPA